MPVNMTIAKKNGGRIRLGLIKKSIHMLCCALAAFLCAQGGIVGGVQAAGTAFFAAGLCAGYNALAMLTGCALGCLTYGRLANMWPLFACMSAWLILHVAGSIEFGSGMEGAKSRAGLMCRAAKGGAGSDALCAAAGLAAGLSNFFMTLAMAFTGHGGIIYCAVSALMGFGLTPIFCVGMGSAGRNQNIYWHKLSAAALGGAVMAGLADCVLGIWDMQALAGGLTMYLLLHDMRRPDKASRVTRAAVGLIMGLWVWLDGGGWGVSAAWLAAGWALGSLPETLGMLAGAALLTLGGLADGFAVGRMAIANVRWLSAVENGLGSLTGMLAGALWLMALGRMNNSADAGALLKKYIEIRAANMNSEALELADELKRLTGCDNELMRRRGAEEFMRALCKGCPRADICRGRSGRGNAANFRKLYDRFAATGEADAGLLPASCIRSGRLAECADGAIERIGAYRADAARQCELLEMARRLSAVNAEACSAELQALQIDPRSSARLIERLNMYNAGCVQACVTRGEPRRAFIEFGPHCGIWQYAPESILRALDYTVGSKFEYADSGCNGILELRECAELNVQAAVRRSAYKENTCGDSAVLTRLPDGRWLAALSDGMGCGAAAAGESHAALASVERMLDGGVDADDSIRIVNELLRLNGTGEMYATLDVTIIDPYAKTAELYKLGALPAALMRAHTLRFVGGGSPPFGILEGVQVSGRSVKLRAGDRIVLVTDGVCDFSDDMQTAFFKNTMYALSDSSPVNAAELILSRMKRRFGMKDDASVTVIDIKPTDSAWQGGLYSLSSDKDAVKRQAEL